MEVIFMFKRSVNCVVFKLPDLENKTLGLNFKPEILVKTRLKQKTKKTVDSIKLLLF